MQMKRFFSDLQKTNCVSATMSDLPWVRERFAGGDAYRVISPHIREAIFATLKRMYAIVNTQARFSFPGAQPCSVMRSDLPRLANDHYVVAAKTDGTRYLMLASGSSNNESNQASKSNQQDMVFMIDRSLSVWIVPLFFRREMHKGRALFDGELVFDKASQKWIYQIFDLIGCGDRYKPRDNYICRMENAARLIRDELLPPAFRSQPQPFITCVKHYYATHQIEKLVEEMRQNNTLCADGLVFTPVRLGIKPFRNQRMFKWKEQKDHTVDFALVYNVHVSDRAEKAKQRLIELSREKTTCENKPTRRVIHLPSNSDQDVKDLLQNSRWLTSDNAKSDHENDNDNNMVISPDAIDYRAFEFHLINTEKDMVFFSKVDASLNRAFLQEHCMEIANATVPMVVECSYEAGQWRIILHRVDREKPNTEFTVEKTLQNIAENISLDEIIEIAKQNLPPHQSNQNYRSKKRPYREAQRHHNTGQAHRRAPAQHHDNIQNRRVQYEPPRGTPFEQTNRYVQPNYPHHHEQAAPHHSYPNAHNQQPFPTRSRFSDRHTSRSSHANYQPMQPQLQPQHAMQASHTVQSTQTRPTTHCGPHRVHPSRLANFSKSNALDLIAAEHNVQVEEYDPMCPEMNTSTTVSESNCASNAAPDLSNMSSLLAQLQSALDADPNSQLANALQKK